MHNYLLLSLLCLGASAELAAQTATVPAATIDVTISNPRLGETTTTTYALGTASGTPLDMATLALRSDDVVTFSNAGAIARGSGTCRVSNVDVSLSFPALGGLVPPQTEALVLWPDCADAPASLPPCGTGDELYLAPVVATNTVSLASYGGGLPDGFTTPFEFSIVASGPGCIAVPTTGTAVGSLDENVALPVTLTEFTATRQVGRDLLSWTVEGEASLDGYAVERSLDGLAFEQVEYVSALGTDGARRSYDTAIPFGSGAQGLTAYYRLRSVDNDGGFALSAVVAVVAAKGSLDYASLLAFPNPSAQGMGFGFNATLSEDSVVEIYDLQGRRLLVHNGETDRATGSGLPAGTYVARVTSTAGSAQCRIVVQ